MGAALVVGAAVACIILCGRGPGRDSIAPRITCPPRITTFNDPIQTNARVFWDPPTHADDDRDGKIYKLNNLYGKPGWRYSGGTSKVGYSARDRAGNWGSCEFDIVVTVIICSMPASIANGFYVCHPSDRPRYGTTCNYGCYRGYRLHGDVTTKCTKQGRWSRSGQRCEKITCPPLESIDHGAFTCTENNKFQSKCSYFCDSGYDIQPGMTRLRTCAHNGRWIGAQPVCIDVERPRIHGCPDSILAYTDRNKQTSTVTWIPPIAQDNSWGGQNRPTSQIVGLAPDSDFPVGTTTVEYTTVDAQGNRARPCRFHVHVRRLTCHTLHTNMDLRVQCPNGYGFGAVCNFSCSGSAHLVGNDVVACEKRSSFLADWAWGRTARQPTCESSPCPELVAGENSALACDNWLYGQFCKMFCKRGYDIPRTLQSRLVQLYVCKQSGRWDINDPDLKLPQCTKSRSGSKNLAADIHYFSGDCCANDTQKLIAENFISVWKDTPGFGTTCLNELDLCHIDNVKVTCGPSCPAPSRRKRTTTDFTTTIHLEIVVSPTEQDEDSTVDEAYENAKTMLRKAAESALQLNVTGDDLDFDLSYKSAELSQVRLSCDEGYSPASYGCVGCYAGEYMGSDGECTPCPQHTYQDEEGSVQCKACPPGTGTDRGGSATLTQCRDLCRAGAASDTGVVPCNPCTDGFYSSEWGSTSCQPCPTATTTTTEGATSREACLAYDLSFTSALDSQALMSTPNTTSIDDFTVSAHVSFQAAITQPTQILDIRVLSQAVSQPAFHLLSMVAGLDGALTITAHSECVLIVPVTQVNVSTGAWYGLVVTWHQMSPTSASLTVYNAGETIIEHECSVDAAAQTYPDDPDVQLLIGSPQFVGLLSEVNLWDSVLGESSIAQTSVCGDARSGSVISWDDVPTQATLDMVSLQMPSLCDDTDECQLGECLNDAECVDLLRGYECICRLGFTGTTCETNIDDCVAHECENNATCIDGVNSYTCQCPHEYKGDFCDIEIISGSWSEWGDWSACTRSCGSGSQTRQRLCNSPPPDPDGQPCEGDHSQIQECNDDPCPDCSELSHPEHGEISCELDLKGDQNCTLHCDLGYEFAEEPQDYYWCGPSTDHMWSFQTDDNPRAQLPDCTAIVKPNKLRVVHTMTYPTMSCDPDALNALGQLLQDNSKTLPCVQDKICSIEKTSIQGCHGTSDDERTRRSSDVVGEVIVSVSDDSDGNFNLTQAIQDGGDEIQRLGRKVASLMQAADILNNATENGDYTLDFRRTTHPVGGYDVSGHVDCPAGMTYVKYYCVPCGTGHYKNSIGLCERCPVGSYQDEEAAERCSPCPTGTTTAGRGSKSLHDCNVAFTGSVSGAVDVTTHQATSSGNARRKPATGNSGVSGIVLAVAIPLALLLLTLAVTVIIYKRCVTRRKEIKLTSSSNHNKDSTGVPNGTAPVNTAFKRRTEVYSTHTNPLYIQEADLGARASEMGRPDDMDPIKMGWPTPSNAEGQGLSAAPYVDALHPSNE